MNNKISNFGSKNKIKPEIWIPVFQIQIEKISFHYLNPNLNKKKCITIFKIKSKKLILVFETKVVEKKMYAGI